MEQEKFKILFLITKEEEWSTLFAHIGHVNKSKDKVESIVVVIINTAILSCLKDNSLTQRKQLFIQMEQDKVEFILCRNTMQKYGIKDEMILPHLDIAEEGGLIKVLSYTKRGYQLLNP